MCVHCVGDEHGLPLRACAGSPCARRLEFVNGNVYEGELAGGEMHGSGTYTWSNGTVFTGTFVHNEVGASPSQG